MRPYVPPPTAKKNPAVHTEEMTSPTGKNARLCPGTTKGSADCTAAEALAAASGSTFVGPEAARAKTPLTKDASFEARVVSTSWLVRVLRAARSICGTRRGMRDSLVGRKQSDGKKGDGYCLLIHRRAHEVAVDLSDVHKHLELRHGVDVLPLLNHQPMANLPLPHWWVAKLAFRELTSHVLYCGA